MLNFQKISEEHSKSFGAVYQHQEMMKKSFIKGKNNLERVLEKYLGYNSHSPIRVTLDNYKIILKLYNHRLEFIFTKMNTGEEYLPQISFAVVNGRNNEISREGELGIYDPVNGEWGVLCDNDTYQSWHTNIESVLSPIIDDFVDIASSDEIKGYIPRLTELPSER